MTQYVKAKVETLEKPIFAWTLVGIAGMLLCVYVYFVSGAVANAIAAKDMQSQIAVLTSSIGSLESTYLAAKSGVTLESALASGFSEPKEVAVYVAKKSPTALSFNR